MEQIRVDAAGDPGATESPAPGRTDAEFLGEIGRKGGASTRARYGTEHYVEIGRRGGQTTAARYGPAFYGRIGRKGGQRVRELVARAKELSPNA